MQRKVTLDEHLAWPETRIGYLLSWINRPVEGWSKRDLCLRLYQIIDEADDSELHF